MKTVFVLIFLSSFLFAQEIDLGKWDKASFSSFLTSINNLDDKKKIEKISTKFLNTIYKANVLVGSQNKKEELIINLSKLDCFTFIDYVEAMKSSDSFETFKSKVIDIRYKDSNITFENRNHFFSDWIYENGFENITSKLSPNTKKEIKYLNKKDNKSLYLDGIKIVKKEIEYLEAKFVDEEFLSKLKTGDYIGIYSTKEGLDVSHVGMIIKKDDEVYFRHTSSKKSNMKVVDELFIDYINKVPGILVLRKINTTQK